MLKRFATLTLVCALSMTVQAEDGDNAGIEHYVIDTRGAHAFVQFRIPHLGYSWLYGRFNEFDGHFSFDPENPENSAVEVTIQTASVDSNHERRDNHLKNEDFLTVEEYPEAHFRSTEFRHIAGDRFHLTGDLTLLGQTRPVDIEVEHIGAGEDPWGGFRRGFSGRTSFALADFGIDYDLGPDSRVVEIILDLEGVRQGRD